MSKCLLCNSSKKDRRCGDFIQRGKITVHEYCLYLSSALLTNGEEDNGLYGFLPEDIQAESKRTSKLRCAYCHQFYANIGCCKSKCQRSFHTLCGIENGCQNEFFGTFRSFCTDHIKKSLKKRPPSNEMCCICYDELRKPGERHIYLNYIEAPCCRNGWFHKQCLQEFARSAGYFFKCPLCNDSKKFREEIPHRGIFVPERDAAWELEPNAFAELLERPSKCEAEVCKNKRGRNSHDEERNPLLCCETCGAVAVHQHCLPRDIQIFTCKDCSELTARVHHNEDSGRASSPLTNPNDNDESEEIDVCALTDSEDEDIDILERAFYNRKNKRPAILSDSSDTEVSTTNSNCHLNSNLENSSRKRANTQLESNSVGKRFRKDSTDEVDQFRDTITNSNGSSKSNFNHFTDCRNINAFDEHDSNQSEESLLVKRKKKIDLVINSSDESSGTFPKRRRDNHFKLVIDSTDAEDSDSSTDFLECNNSRSQRIAQSSKESTTKINERKSLTESASNSSFRQETNAANISCVANRTRRRKSSIYLDTKLSDDSSSNFESCQSTEKNRTSSTSSTASNACSSLGYSSTETAEQYADYKFKQNYDRIMKNSHVSSTPMTDISSKRLELRKTSSTSSASSDTKTHTTSESSSVLDISCVANRTRRRKSIYYSSSFEIINEES